MHRVSELVPLVVNRSQLGAGAVHLLPAWFKSRPCSVYLVKGGDAYKIGMSHNPVARRSSMQSGSPVKLASKKFENALEVEAEWHMEFTDKHIHGEWFALSGEEVADVVKRLT